MSINLREVALNISYLPLNIFVDNTSVQTLAHSDPSHQQTVATNASLEDECASPVFGEGGYLPWDNPDNIVSANVEQTSRRVKDFSLVFLFLIGGPGNVINMAVFYKQGLKDRVNLCLFALSLADELYLISAMSHHAEQVSLQFTTKENYGPMITFLSNNYLSGILGSFYVSTILTAIIASERCFCVLRPLKYQNLMRTSTMAAIISVVYVLTVGLYFIVALRYHIGCVRDPISGAAVKANIIGELYKANKELVDIVDGVVFGASVPVVVIVVVITTTIITIVKLRQIVTWRTETSSSISAREVALTKMLVGTSILFIVCVFPFAVTRISWLFLPEVNTGRRNHNFFLTSLWINELLTYVNSSLNIFVYYVMGSRYRATFWELFSRKRKSEKAKENVS
ncbi:uncharacterized protein LOC143296675 [Babylonia areolata]|uniref:uncharacterized protein LOC143296675 n=1 Tax=Babylonia areolata TaxID=304850 RepID=UPI003FD1EB1C